MGLALVCRYADMALVENMALGLVNSCVYVALVENMALAENMVLALVYRCVDVVLMDVRMEQA